MFVQSRDEVSYSDPHWEEKIYKDPLVIEELEKQERDLNEIESEGELTAGFLNRLRESACVVGLKRLVRTPSVNTENCS
jgi:hypothetical protein